MGRQRPGTCLRSLADARDFVPPRPPPPTPPPAHPRAQTAAELPPHPPVLHHQAFSSVLGSLGVVQHLRGLSSNVANYQPLGTPCPKSAFDDKMHNYCQTRASDACCADACNLLAQYSSGNNEYNYIRERRPPATPWGPGVLGRMRTAV